MNKEISKILIAGTEYDIRDSRFDEASQAETARQTAETARQNAEQGRVTAEQQRADAEAARAEEFATFEGTLAAKEDAANKVTSIGADANNTTFPTTRAVLNSIAEVKNIEVTPEMLSESTKQFINASGGGTITNFADDEDLTSVDNVLKLADKDYSPTSYSGMGRVYLRKNMVDGKNILTQEMMTKENTIYIIQYDYDLNGATINVPANCTLDFQGGSLGNGTVNFNNTYLESACKQIFNNIVSKGSISNCTIYAEWFGDFGKEVDGATIINSAITFCRSFSKSIFEIQLPNRQINIYTPINIYGKICIKGSHISGRTGRTQLIACEEGICVFSITQHYCDGSIKDVDIVSNGSTARKYTGIYMSTAESFMVKDVKVLDADMAYNLSASSYGISLCRFENVSAINCLVGLKVRANEVGGWCNGLYISPNWFSNNNIGIDINIGQVTTIQGGNCEIGMSGTYDWTPDKLGVNISGKAHVNIFGCVWGENLSLFGKVSENARLNVYGDSHIISNIEVTGDAMLNIENDAYLSSADKPFDYIKPILDLDHKAIAKEGYWSYFINKADLSLYKFMRLRTKKVDYTSCDVPYTVNINTEYFKEAQLSSEWSFMVDFVYTEISKPISIDIHKSSESEKVRFIINPKDNHNYRFLSVITGNVKHYNLCRMPTTYLANSLIRTKFGVIFNGNIIKIVFDDCIFTKEINETDPLLCDANNISVLGGVEIIGLRVYNSAIDSKIMNIMLKEFDNISDNSIINVGITENRPASAPIGFRYYDTTINSEVILEKKEYSEISTPAWKLINVATNRPTLSSAEKGYQVFDTTLGKPIWWTGSAWVDATGQEV